MSDSTISKRIAALAAAAQKRLDELVAQAEKHRRTIARLDGELARFDEREAAAQAKAVAKIIKETEKEGTDHVVRQPVS